MKRLFTVILFIMTAQLYAQNKWVVQLKDKSNSPFSISNPSQYLSARSIQRRINQNIPINPADLPVNPAYVDGISGTGAIILGKSKWLNVVIIEADSAILDSIRMLPYVDFIQNVRLDFNPNRNKVPDKFQQETFGEKIPFSSDASRSARLDYGKSLNQVEMLGGSILHDNGSTGEGFIIAVIDAGFANADNMMVFDRLRSENKILATWDFVSNNSNVYDDDSHGSYVLSLMGSYSPGNIIGTAPDAAFLLLRSEDAATETLVEEYYWAAAAEFADSAGADVINSSLGYTTFDDPAQNHTYADLDGNTTPVTRAADFAASKGMIVVNSAGNSGNGSWNFIGAPADADSILSVGAVDDMRNYASFSSKGPSADGRVKPDVAAQGQDAYVADISNNGVFPGNGTSFSSPLIAGMAASLWQCYPEASNMQVINSIKQSASHYANPDYLTGHGIPDFPLACLLLKGLERSQVNHGDELIFTGPNPVHDALNFSFYSDKDQTVIVQVSNILQQLVYKDFYQSGAVSVKKYSIPFTSGKGMYVLKIYTEDKIFSRKIIFQ